MVRKDVKNGDFVDIGYVIKRTLGKPDFVNNIFGVIKYNNVSAEYYSIFNKYNKLIKIRNDAIQTQHSLIEKYFVTENYGLSNEIIYLYEDILTNIDSLVRDISGWSHEKSENDLKLEYRLIRKKYNTFKQKYFDFMSDGVNDDIYFANLWEHNYILRWHCEYVGCLNNCLTERFIRDGERMYLYVKNKNDIEYTNFIHEYILEEFKNHIKRKL